MKTYIADETYFSNAPPGDQEFQVRYPIERFTEWRVTAGEHLGSQSMLYRENGLHREDGPAVVWDDGYEEWYYESRYHRADGPAVIDPDGDLHAWYIHGMRIQSYEQLQKMTKCSDEQIILLKLKWGKMG